MIEIVILQLPVPPGPVKVPTYVVPLPVGMTPCVPAVPTVPIEVIKPCVAYWLCHDKLTVLPSSTALELARSVQVGRGEEGVVVAGVVVAMAEAGTRAKSIATPKSKARNFMPKIISLLFAHNLVLLYSVRVLAKRVGTEVVKRDAL